jgi:hypothetical protein
MPVVTKIYSLSQIVLPADVRAIHRSNDACLPRNSGESWPSATGSRASR